MDNQLLSIRPKTGYGFIYCYTSPSGKNYIGQTKRSLKERANFTGKGYKGSARFWNAIEKYGYENFEVKILAEVPLDIIDEEEIFYIHIYDSTNEEKGYNIDTGGQNSIFDTLNSIVVYQYDLDGNFVQEYPSIADAARALNIYHSGIRKALHHPEKRAADSYWRFEKHDKIEPSKMWNHQPHAKKIYRYSSKTGELIDEFDSVREANRITGISRPTIQSHISGKVKIGKDYTFRLDKLINLYDESSTTISEESRD